MPDSLLDQIRARCAEVAERAEQVRIVRDRIPAYAASLPLAQATAPALDPATHYLGAPDDTLAFVVTLDAINFGSGYFPHVRKRPGYSGYFTMASGLKGRFERVGPIGAKELAR